MASNAHEEVVGLDVPVNEVLVVYILNASNHLQSQPATVSKHNMYVRTYVYIRTGVYICIYIYIYIQNDTSPDIPCHSKNQAETIQVLSSSVNQSSS